MNAATRGGGHRRTCHKQKIRLTQSTAAMRRLLPALHSSPR